MPASEPAIERGSGRPEKGYMLGRERVPSVTERLHDLGSPDGLIRWACKLAVEDHGKGARFWDAVNAHERARDAAADLGTACHGAIQAWELGDDVGPHVDASADPLAVMDALLRWREWRRDEMAGGGAGLTMIAIEVPLVSTTLRAGGTPDFIWRDRAGVLTVGDLKTGSSVSSTALLQIGAYAAMWWELRGELPRAGTIVHVPAKGGPLRTVSLDGDAFAECCEDVLDFLHIHARDAARKLRHKIR